MASPESNIYKIGVIVSRKEGVPNPEASALTSDLQRLGFEGANVLSIGQLIKLDIEAVSLDDAIDIAKQASD